MGYILPINQTQYLQYRERMLKTRNTNKSPEVVAIPPLQLKQNFTQQSAVHQFCTSNNTIKNTSGVTEDGLGENIDIYV
ncbi:MAG TPA: hypothetical protein VKZ77_01540 [Bacillaceae bacterium]|nr:hypothetical protein [Paenibacillus bovis]HLU21150.1 hypothetical protein [Bacillaceae bacterium]